jgi:oxepin-CoA hydrolase/3-oxo-5,6-dehydrosuberyl-CoA semialdehyde dehydrogenase
MVPRPADLCAAATYAREVGGPALRSLTFAERAEMLDLAVLNGGSTRSDAKFETVPSAGPGGGAAC